jgi:hypothetical protein
LALLWFLHIAVAIFFAVHVSEDIMAGLESRSIADYFADPVLLNSQYKKVSALVSQAALAKL